MYLCIAYVYQSWKKKVFSGHGISFYCLSVSGIGKENNESTSFSDCLARINCVQRIPISMRMLDRFDTTLSDICNRMHCVGRCALEFNDFYFECMNKSYLFNID